MKRKYLILSGILVLSIAMMSACGSTGDKDNNQEEIISGEVTSDSQKEDSEGNADSQEDETVMSEEMMEYTALMEIESENPAIEDYGIALIQSDLLDRCETFEQHITKYPAGETYTDAYEMYYELMNAAIAGNYNGVNSESHYYINTKDMTHIDSMAMSGYETYIENHPDTVTSKVLQDYLTVLNENENELNDNVKAFYTELGEVIQNYLIQ